MNAALGYRRSHAITCQVDKHQPRWKLRVVFSTFNAHSIGTFCICRRQQRLRGLGFDSVELAVEQVRVPE
jgi:hypothetical protein